MLKLNAANVRKVLSRYRCEADLMSGLDTVPNQTDQSAKSAGQDIFEPHSRSRDLVLDCISKHPSWLTFGMKETSARECALLTHLQALQALGHIDADGRARYRLHRDRKPRPLKACHLEPFPKCRGTNHERKLLTGSELRRRSWPMKMIRDRLPQAGKHYIRNACSALPETTPCPDANVPCFSD